MRPPAGVKLASGGHATVWLSRSANGELVATKRLHPHLVDDPDVRSALRREAEIALRLRHPHVVRLRSIEIEDDAPVLVMDYVDGATVAELVRDWVKSGRTDTARAAIRIVLDAAQGLHALHELRTERGEPLDLVHRDVSPQNVLVGVDGRALVSDFGLAKTLSRDRATTEGVLKGKAGYLAPEYVRGERGDRRQDVFSLGVVAWESLARTRLFRGESDVQTLDHILSMPIPPLADTAPELGRAAGVLDAVLARALARYPDARFSTAEEFGRALAEAAGAVDLLGSSEDVRHGFSPERLHDIAARKPLLDARPGRRRRALITLLIVGAVGAAAAATIRLRASPSATVVAEAPSQRPAPSSSLVPASSSTPTHDVNALPNASDSPRSASPALRSRPPRSPASSATAQPRPNPY